MRRPPAPPKRPGVAVELDRETWHVPDRREWHLDPAPPLPVSIAQLDALAATLTEAAAYADDLARKGSARHAEVTDDAYGALASALGLDQALLAARFSGLDPYLASFPGHGPGGYGYRATPAAPF